MSKHQQIRLRRAAPRPDVRAILDLCFAEAEAVEKVLPHGALRDDLPRFASKVRLFALADDLVSFSVGLILGGEVLQELCWEVADGPLEAFGPPPARPPLAVLPDGVTAELFWVRHSQCGTGNPAPWVKRVYPGVMPELRIPDRFEGTCYGAFASDTFAVARIVYSHPDFPPVRPVRVPAPKPADAQVATHEAGTQAQDETSFPIEAPMPTRGGVWSFWKSAWERRWKARAVAVDHETRRRLLEEQMRTDAAEEQLRQQREIFRRGIPVDTAILRHAIQQEQLVVQLEAVRQPRAADTRRAAPAPLPSEHQTPHPARPKAAQPVVEWVVSDETVEREAFWAASRSVLHHDTAEREQAYWREWASKIEQQYPHAVVVEIKRRTEELRKRFDHI